MMCRKLLIAVWLLIACCAAGQALAHEVRPGYLELRELDAQHYDCLLYTSPSPRDS